MWHKETMGPEINMRRTKYIALAFALLSIVGCGGGHKPADASVEEDTNAKKELQGVWVNEDGEDATFRIKGDSVYFPDTTSAPAYFRVERDTFVLLGANVTKYPIVKRTPHLFVFTNQNGERIRLVKSDDPSYLELFEQKQTVIRELNQRKLVKRDTIVYHQGEKYHCYVQVNPTTYKVVKASYTDDGVEVDNVYYDNIIHFGVFNGDRKIFSSNITKDGFKEYVPSHFLRQSVLSDMTFHKVDEAGIHYFAILGIPNSSSSYMVEMIFGYDGKLTRRISDN